ncbi:MAG: helix-turn-helix transcriptional regulator [Clostridia bacterium]|nr:helix-turn-helix transcriptional regulator [Clostridia bacterium]
MRDKLTTGERLKDLRVSVMGLNLEELAAQTGLSRSALSKYENDEFGDISTFALIKLAQFYGVSTDYLLGLTEETTPSGQGNENQYFSKEVLGVLKSGKINRRLLSEIILHKNFRRLMVDMEIAVDRLLDQQVQGYSIGAEILRRSLMEQFDQDGEDVALSALKYMQEGDALYMKHQIHEELDSMILDIRKAHEKDSATADMGLLPDPGFLKEMVQSARNGATPQDMAMQVLGLIGIPEKKQTPEDANALLQITAKSDQIANMKRNRGKQHPVNKPPEVPGENE